MASTHAFAVNLEELKPTFMERCAAEGNESEDCNCIFDNWTKSIPDEQLENAKIALDIIWSGKQPSQEEMSSVVPMIMAMTNTTLMCATGNS